MEKKLTWQIANLKIKQQVKPVKVAKYNINAANCNVLCMMQYVLCLRNNTQPKYRDLSTNNTRRY